MGSGDDDAAVLSNGQLVGKYRVESLIGKGGMAAVYRGVHAELDQRVAIKTLLPSFLADDRLVRRFLREATTIAKIRSKHVAQVFDIGRLETTKAPYIVLELLEGQDLGKKLETSTRFPVRTAVDYIIQASEGLGRAHARGIVHRDVKPSNLFLARDSDGQHAIKVIDFGIAKQMATDGYKLTTTSEVFGSPQYMAPEQIRATRNVDAQTDVWSLGIVLYELLTGASAFTGGSVLELAGSILHNSPTPLTTYRHDIPPELERVILRCLEKSPARRPSGVLELVLALAPFATPAGAAIAEDMRRSSPRFPVLVDPGDPSLEPTLLADGSSDRTSLVSALEFDAMKTTPDGGPPFIARNSGRANRRWLGSLGLVLGAAIGAWVWTSRVAEDKAPSDARLVQAPPAPPPPVESPPPPIERPVEADPAATSVVVAAKQSRPPSEPAKSPPAASSVPRARPAPTAAPSASAARAPMPIIPRKGGD